MKVATLKNPPKKRAKWPWVLLIIFLIIFILPVVLIYALFYDASTKKVTLQDNLTLTNVGNRIIVDSLDTAKSEAKIDVIVSENDIDNILHLTMEKYAANNKFVKKAYMYVKGNTYNFYIDLDGYIIKSRLKVTTNLELSEDGSDFVFKIKDIALGRVGGILKSSKGLIDKFVNEDTINNFIADSGLGLTFDKEQFAIVYPKENLLQDLSKLTDDQDVGLYFDVMDTMLRENMIEFDLESGHFAEGVVDLSKIQTNDLVTDDEAHIKVESSEVEALRDDLVTLVDNGDVDPTVESQLSYAFSFLFGGWDYLTDEAKTALADVDFSYIGIDDKEAYEGFGLVDANTKLYEKMKASVDVAKLIDKNLDPRYLDVCTLTETDINNYLAGRSIVGYTSLLYRQTESSYKINYITVENFYMNIYQNSESVNIAEMVCKIDVNGYPTSLTFETEMSGSGFSDNKLTFEVKDIQFGETSAEYLKDDFFAIIYDALNDSSDTSLRANKEDYTITVDFTDIMTYVQEQAEAKVEETTGTYYDLSSYFVMDNMTYEISGASRDDEGTMKLSLINAINY